MKGRSDEPVREALLDRIVDTIVQSGIGSLSLRPLAKELGVSPASLLYHFRSKEELTVEILKLAGKRQRALFADLGTDENSTPGDVCRAVWRVVAAPRARALFRLFFEAYGIALVDRGRIPDFFPGAIENWLTFLSPTYERAGLSKREARVKATIVLAGFRGFLLDLCATGDTARLNRAVETWIGMLS